MRVLFAHGAGLGSGSAWMRGWAARLATLGRVTTFDYPYMAAGRKLPDPLPRLLEAHRQALRLARGEGEGPVVLAGKSMGSRVSCHLALEERDLRAVICFGFPLRSPGKRRAVRDEVLVASRVPILFLAGTRDRLCPLDQLEAVRARMQAPSAVHVVESGDHSLLVTRRWEKATGCTQDDVDQEILEVVARFVDSQKERRAVQ